MNEEQPPTPGHPGPARQLPREGFGVPGRQTETPLLSRGRMDRLVLPVTAIAVAGAIGAYAYTRMPPVGQSLPAGALEGFALLLSFCLATCFFPAIAILYGWHSGNRFRAFLVGMLPFPVLFFSRFLIVHAPIPAFPQLVITVLSVAALSTIPGLAGFFAAQKARPGLAVSFLLTGLWIFLWMNAFH